MDMDQIKTFVAISRTRSFSRAAQALHRSQPAISRRVELLSRDLGVPLFERFGGTIVLTDAGIVLLPYAEAVLAAARDAAEAVKAVREGDAGRVSLALVGTLADATFAAVLKAFKRRYPNVRLDVQTATSQEVGEIVRRGEASIGLRYQTDTSPDLVSQIVAHEKLIVVGPAGHRLADNRNHAPSALAGERWVVFPARRTRETFAQFLERTLVAAGVQAEIVPIDSLTAQKRLVEAGFGIGLIAESGVREELRHGTLKALKIPALCASIPVAVVHRRDGYLSASARSLLATIDTTFVKPDRCKTKFDRVRKTERRRS